MIRKPMISPTQIKSLILLILFVASLVVLVIPFESKNSSFISIHRRMGFILGDKFCGEMSLTGNLASQCDQTQLYINHKLQSNASGNQVNYDFNTNRFPLGHNEIRLVGLRNNDKCAEFIRIVEFIPIKQSITYFLLFSFIILTAIAIFLTSNHYI
ncbi:hypothetical protein DSAG12_03392 [Promethearchaeum syntrophicum]|uniref:Uncharacterized protein n=1 Tax=Promethearchaeum syntrophicum TaxID=2594042 RepID=A0A5B9DET9_9ARCH|nr:hypothetical protein [Candidatus Prometheoarchaeum syntrophicum]